MGKPRTIMEVHFEHCRAEGNEAAVVAKPALSAFLDDPTISVVKE